MRFEDVLEEVGSFGFFQKRLYVLVFLASIPNAFLTIGNVFLNYTPDFHCELPVAAMRGIPENLSTYINVVNDNIPMEEDEYGNIRRSQCYMYERNYSLHSDGDQNKNLVECTNGFHYLQEINQETAATSFNMICSQAWMAPFVISLYLAGMGFGTFFGVLADKYGRRPLFLWATFFHVLVTALLPLAWNFTSYSVAMFLGGCTSMVNYTAAFVLATELTSIKKRNMIGISSFYSFSVGYVVTPLLAYLLQNWRWYLFAAAGISALQLPYYWLIPESARWLLTKGRKEDAIKSLQEIARLNGKKIDVEDLFSETEINLQDEQVPENSRVVVPDKFLSLLTNPLIRGRYIVLYFCWFVTSIVYYGFSLKSSNFNENRFLSCLYAGLAEFPAYFICYYSITFFGRIRVMVFFLLLCGICCVLLPFLLDYPDATTALPILGKGADSGAFYLAFVLAVELSPTLQRSTSLFAASGCARAGGFLAPYLMFIGKIHPVIPYLVMGSLMILSGLLGILYIPETRGMSMPESIEDVKRNKRIYGLKLWKCFSTRTGKRDPNDAVSLENQKDNTIG